MLDDWDLLGKSRTYVTDNASNVYKAIVKVGKHKWLGCFGHTINLIVKAGMDVASVAKLAGTCKRIVTYIKSSNLAHERLKENDFFTVTHFNCPAGSGY